VLGSVSGGCLLVEFSVFEIWSVLGCCSSLQDGFAGLIWASLWCRGYGLRIELRSVVFNRLWLLLRNNQVDVGDGFPMYRCRSVLRREWSRVGQELWPGTLHSEEQSVACVCPPACSV
jgi:hypothetical protein